jgi:imidazolonepropionase-like amidohydrolase
MSKLTYIQKLAVISLLHFLVSLFCIQLIAQNKYNKIALINAITHIGNGKIIQQGIVVINKNKIELVDKYANVKLNEKEFDTIIDLKGAHLYPGLINTNNVLGLHDAEAVRATRDFSDVGEMNPHVRALIAYNTDNQIVPTIKTNGILYTQVTPRGGLISGSSSIMALEGWNWEDAVLRADDGIHLNFPKKQTVFYSEDEAPAKNQNKKYEEEINQLNLFFTNAKAYSFSNVNQEQNLRFESMRGIFAGTQNLYVHADKQKDILLAIHFAKVYGIQKIVIVGGKEAYKITKELKQNKIPVMLNRVNDLPDNSDDDVDLVYKMPYLLQKDSVLFCLQLEGDMEAMQSRNLPFNAGHAVGYGLSEEAALRAITLNVAKILGLDDLIGSIEVGKLATLVVSKGNILDIKTNEITLALIAGQFVKLSNRQNDLYQQYKNKYRIK